MPSRTIDQVLERLDAIIDQSRRTGSRRGFFAALYRRVTRAVKLGIVQGRFADGRQMERLDVNFAERYFEAYDQSLSGSSPTGSWRIVFDAAEGPGFLVLQHLLAGMNAHINLDLGIATAQTCPGPALAALRQDFDVINDILAEQIDGVQAGIATLSPWIGILDFFGGRTDERIANFSIRAARRLAWATAERFAPLSPAEQRLAIADLDGVVGGLGRAILRPGPILSTANWLVRRVEAKDVVRIIDTLSGTAM